MTWHLEIRLQDSEAVAGTENVMAGDDGFNNISVHLKIRQWV